MNCHIIANWLQPLMCFHHTHNCKGVATKISWKFIIDGWMDEKQCQHDKIIVQ